MIKLKPEEFSLARELLEQLDIQLAVLALLDGESAGEVYLDNKDDPRAAYAWTMKRYFLAGKSDVIDFNQAVKRLFVTEIFPKGIAQGESNFSLFYSPEDWGTMIPEEIFEEIYPKEPHHYYRCRKLFKNWQEILPPGYALVEVDKALVENTGLKNHAELIEEIHSECGSVAHFLENRFGYCVLHEDQLVTWCLSEYNIGARCEVGIATQPDHRRKGLATAASLALVEKALNAGYQEVGWHCYAGNEPSIATALASGFEKVCQYPAYWVSFNKAIAFGVNGNQRFEQRAYHDAAEWYLRAIDQGGAPAWVYWNNACAYTHLDQLEQAFDYLNQAIDHGFDDIDHVMSSKHFEKWHATDVWKSVIQRLAG